MNKKQLISILTLSSFALTLAACQIAPVNGKTTVSDASGAGSKKISALLLVDGSCQIEKDTTSFPANSDYYYIDDAEFTDFTFTPKADGAKAKLYHDGYLTNPNQKETVKEVWEEFIDVAKTYVPEGFTVEVTEVKSEDWDDAYMETVPGPEVNAWKGYVFSVSYSWDDVEEYVSKTKTLIGNDLYAMTELQELDDAETPWVTFTQNGDNYVWSEAYVVNYWSAYGIFDGVMNSEYFKRNDVTTDNAFSVGLQEYVIGEGDPVKVKVDNKSSVDEEGNLKFITASGKLSAGQPSDTSEQASEQPSEDKQSEAKSEEVVSTPATSTPATSTPATSESTEPAKKKGCGGALATSGIISLLALAGALILKRRK